MALRTGHIGLNVTDLDRSCAFYQDVFGLEVLGQSTEEGQRFAFLGNPDVSSDDFLDKLAITLWEQSDGRFGASSRVAPPGVPRRVGGPRRTRS